MHKVSIKKIGFIAVVFLVAPINALNVYVTNTIPDINFNIAVQGNAPIAVQDNVPRFGNFLWSSGSLLPDGKLSQKNGVVHALSCCMNASNWNLINLYVNNSKYQQKTVAIPPSPEIEISFQKNSAGQVEVHRSRIVERAGSRERIDGVLVTTLTPADYE